MKKIIALGFPLMVLVSVVTVLVLLEGQRVPDWQAELSEYITQHRLPGETIKVGVAVQASNPENFQESMGRAVPNDWPWGIGEVPFPPSALKCILLERDRKPIGGTQTEPKRQVIFVGYHSDSLWHVGWLVHEGPVEPFTPEDTTTFNTIGCDLALE